MKQAPAPGSRVRLTASFLRSTGQYTGDEPRKRWTVQECGCRMCARGHVVAINEPSCAQSPGEPVRLRHVHIANLESCS